MIFYIPPGRERGLYRTTMMDAGPGRKRGKGGEKRQERVAAANSHVFRRAGRPVRGLLSEGAATTRRCVPSSFDPRSSARISEESRAVCHVVHTELARSPSARPLARSLVRSLVLGEDREGPPRFPRTGPRGRRISTGDGGTMTAGCSSPSSPPTGGVNPGGGNTRSTRKTQGPRTRHTVGTRRESPRTMTMIMI